MEPLDDERIEAQCMKMCPDAECLKREKQDIIHILETDHKEYTKKKVANRQKMIKCYSRSAAGQVLADPKLLRPPEILLSTVEYIFKNILQDNRVSKIARYNFIDDRLRSVKQDGIIQRLSGESWFQILPPIIHFYVYSAYSLCEESVNNFDPKLNKDQLVDCVTRLIKVYEQGSLAEYADIYAEVEALYLIINIEDVKAINRAVSLNLPQERFRSTVKFALKYYTKNYYSVFKALSMLPVRPSCLFVAYHLNGLRKYCLEVMSSAYSSKTSYYPLLKIKVDLGFNSVEEAIAECAFYELNMSQDKKTVNFVKKIFKSEKAPPKPIRVLDEKLQYVSLTELLYHPKEGTKN